MNPSHQPVVSIVIACYNQGRFLGEAIDSALRQTYPVEVIVVDDGSTDNTASVVQRYRAARHIAQRNQGAAAARMCGFRESRGDFVIFLDADDRLLPHAVGAGIESLTLHSDWAFVSGHVRLVHEDGSPAGVPPQQHEIDNEYIGLLRSNYIWTPGAVMYRRSTIETVGGFQSSAGGSADYDLNIRIARRFAFGCHHDVILEYRQHGANMSADLAHMLKSAVSVRRALRKYVRKDQAARQAWKAGIVTVQADFGGRLVEQVKQDLRAPGRRGRALRGMLCLFRYYPAGVMRIMSAGVSRLVTSSH